VAQAIHSLVAAAPQRSAFFELDERLSKPITGLVNVVVAECDQEAYAAHIARRFGKTGKVALIVSSGPSLPVVEMASRQLGVRANALGEKIRGKVLVLVASSLTDWDRSCLESFVDLTDCAVFLCGARIQSARETFEVGNEALDASDREVWLRSVAEAAPLWSSAATLGDLERLVKRIASEQQPSTTALSAKAQSSLHCLRLLGRPWSAARASELGDNVAELVAAGVVDDVAGSLVLRVRTSDATAPTHEAVRAATLLVSENDGFALAHAATLLATSNGSAALETLARAFELLPSMGAKRAAIANVRAAAEAGAEPARSEVLSTLARISLDAGEHGEALQALKLLRGDAAATFGVSIVWAKAWIGAGELTSAEAALDRAAKFVTLPEQASELLVERAELAYLAGAFDKIRELEASFETLTPSLRLKARNLLGKLQLSEGHFAAAEKHFAEDTMAALALGNREAEYRARLNQGIAILSRGSLAEARRAFTSLIADATATGETTAKLYALTNLGVVAYREHAYGEALSIWEQLAELQTQNVEARLRVLTTLGALRTRLGLLDHAEHSLRFAKRLVHEHTRRDISARVYVELAEVALAKRNTEEAKTFAQHAESLAASSGSKTIQLSAAITLARVALEEGDVRCAQDALARVEGIDGDAFRNAERALLGVELRRARGEGSAFTLATQALELATVSQDDDLLREAHTLLAILEREHGNVDEMFGHVTEASKARDRVAQCLTSQVRAAYLSKASVLAVQRLQATLSSEAVLAAPKVGAIIEADNERVLVGQDERVVALRAACKRVASVNATVLIHGESGTGKELVAASVHASSDRASGPFVAVNCAALAESLLLSELFGHEKGAFTGASTRKRGRFELAENGTLFLDEIGDISPQTQVALLRVLQEKTFERVGGMQSIQTNARIVCATHRDLKAMVERGEFREDLYYRLRQIQLEVPSLRQRPRDLPALVDHLLARVASERSENTKTLSADALELFTRYRWPGNVRELENAIRVITLFSDESEITLSDVIANHPELSELAQAGPRSEPPQSMRIVPVAASSAVGVDFEADEESALLPQDESGATQVAYAQVRGGVSLTDLKRQIERDCIARALAETKGNITKAATLLGMKRPRLSQLVKQYGFSVSLENA
jgi:DNA-binding NtrC family response regulator